MGCCARISSNLYLEARHNPAAKVVYDSILAKHDLPCTKAHPQRVFTSDSIEMCWDYNVPTVQNVEHNKPDIVYWNKDTKEAWIIDISVPLDVNVTRKHQEKVDNYMPLASELQRIYREYKIRVVPIILGALGVITADMKNGLHEIPYLLTYLLT